jgi:hypothetical protein
MIFWSLIDSDHDELKQAVIRFVSSFLSGIFNFCQLLEKALAGANQRSLPFRGPLKMLSVVCQ